MPRCLDALLQKEEFLALKTTVFAVGSITYAIKAKKLLSSEGIVAKLVKTNPEKTEHGCAYGIEFPQKDLLSAANAMRSANIYYQLYEK